MTNVAIIGCGNLGRAHAQALAGMAGVSIAALCDAAPGATTRLHQTLTEATSGRLDPRHDADPADVLSDGSIEAVWITTPNDSHLDLTVGALEAGKHVFVEKPLARTAEECARIAAAARRTGRLVMTGYKMRYFAMVAMAKELIPDPISVQVTVLDGRWPDDKWVNDPESGGGNVAAQGCHGTDLLRHLVGSDPREVYAVGGRFYSDRVPTNLSAVYRFDGNVAGSLTVGDADTPPATSKFFAQAVGDGCSVTLTDRLTELTFHRSGEDPVRHCGPEAPWEVEDAAFLHAIATGGPSPIDAVDGWYATAMTEYAIRSAADQHPVGIRLPDGLAR